MCARIAVFTDLPGMASRAAVDEVVAFMQGATQNPSDEGEQAPEAEKGVMKRPAPHSGGLLKATAKGKANGKKQGVSKAKAKKTAASTVVKKSVLKRPAGQPQAKKNPVRDPAATLALAMSDLKGAWGPGESTSPQVLICLVSCGFVCYRP